MAQLILFKALPGSSGWEDRTFPDGGLSDILAQHHDFPGRPAPGPGYRLLEGKHDQDSASFAHHGGLIHERESLWQVVRTEKYAANTGLEEFWEIILAYCEYSPLPEAKNPWIEMGAAVVSPDSLGGDAIAYEAWKA